MLCECCSLACCIQAGCKTGNKAQKAALCPRGMTLRTQLVHGGRHGITLTCRIQVIFLLQAIAHISSQPGFSSS